ncbi:hypothetical protein [Bradyrhizobium sp. BR 1432]|uniref:hypothetical protein n=1 Tax=Bradyrhizobium sp. BR 1432 TaxID=3447966 RepID=UPI003EE5812A
MLAKRAMPAMIRAGSGTGQLCTSRRVRIVQRAYEPRGTEDVDGYGLKFFELAVFLEKVVERAQLGR